MYSLQPAPRSSAAPHHTLPEHPHETGPRKDPPSPPPELAPPAAPLTVEIPRLGPSARHSQPARDGAVNGRGLGGSGIHSQPWDDGHSQPVRAGAVNGRGASGIHSQPWDDGRSQPARQGAVNGRGLGGSGIHSQPWDDGTGNGASKSQRRSLAGGPAADAASLRALAVGQGAPQTARQVSASGYIYKCVCVCVCVCKHIQRACARWRWGREHRRRHAR